jgi:prephenate dehydrogenase
VLGVIGLGLVGTSVALAARRRWPGVQVVGIDRSSVLLQPKVTGVLDVASTTLDALIDADIVVLAIPVDAICSTLPHLAGTIPAARLVIDTGSSKRRIMTAARDAGLRSFVGGHPMAGAATAGAELARPDLFDGQTWFVVESLDAALVPAAQAFVEALGARPQAVDADTHDLVMGAVSHLPQVVASVLMTVVAEAAGADGLAWSGAGLRDTTRLASSAPEMWTSLLASNADRVGPLLTEVAARLQALATRLKDAKEVERVFREAAAARARLDPPSP